ncbi:translocation/assembly module TamB domain-containing protein [Acetobacteraceae bacterium ESL0709]|nr:translocation/assembly module TamB domain-containing protein [Acetobacteraceae bacterium ESL0697]MDF7678216.1 translocation/assembly module TamB domain-containing protein [Acetobacteraceae bacterium ESL0709]
MRLHHRLYYAFILITGLLISIVGMSITALVIALNLPSVQQLVEDRLPAMTGNMVHIEGVSGFLPTHIRLQKLTLVDEKGIWLELDKADMRWSPLALLHMKAKVKSFKAERFVFERLPYSSEPSPPPAPDEKPFHLSLAVDIRSLRVPHIEIGAALAQKRLLLSLSGKTRISTIDPFIQGVTFKNFPSMMINAVARRLDVPAQLSVVMDKRRKRATGAILFNEGPDGFITSLLHMPALDPFMADIRFSGTYRKFTTKVKLRAGQVDGAQLRIDQAGTVNLYKKSGKVALSASSPAMTVRPDLGWDQLDVKILLDGFLSAPGGEGSVRIDNLATPSVNARSIDLHFKGDHKKRFRREGKLVLTGAVEGLRLPGKEPLLLAFSPLTLNAVYHPFQKTQPFDVSLQHELLQISLEGTVRPALKAHLALTLPSLEPFAKFGNIVLKGKSHFDADLALPMGKEAPLKAALKGRVQISAGLPQAVGLIGDQGVLALNVQRDSRGIITLAGLDISGRALQIKGNGVFNPKGNGSVSSDLLLSLSDLKAAYSALQGHMSARLKAEGQIDDIKTSLHLEGIMGAEQGTRRLIPGPLTLDAAIDHLPAHPDGKVTVKGELDKVPLALDVAFHKDKAGNLGAILNRLDWKSLQGHGTVLLPKGKKIPRGDLDITLSRLDAFAPLIGQAVKGSLTLGLHTQRQQGAEGDHVHLDLKSQFAMADYALRSLILSGTADQLSGNPVIDLSARFEGIKVKDIKGDVQLSVKGPQKALGVKLSGKFDNLLEAPARIDMAALLDVPGSQLSLNRLESIIKGETLHLQSPATIKYGAPFSIEHFKVTAASRDSVPASLSVNGEVKPKLDLAFSLDHVTPSLATPFMPNLMGDGVISAQGKLGGTLEDPAGSVTAEGQNLHLKTGYAASFPKAFFKVKANLARKQAQLLLEAEAGEKLAAQLKGNVPLSREGTMSVRSTGKMDLTLVNAILGASGMGVKGMVDMDVLAQGTLTQPRLSGAVHLSQGEFTHYAQGVHLTEIKGDLVAQNDVLILKDFGLKAGKGTMSLSGQVGLLRSGLPLDLTFVMDKAQPVISDLLEETLDSSIHIHGQARSEIDLDGGVKIVQANINIPDSMPDSVPQLEIIKPDKEQKERPAPPVVVKLNMDVMSPGQILVHGHGLFAEMSGKLHLGGTNLAPEVTGGFDLKQGNFNLAGVSLNFTKGRVAFNGSGVGHRLDPTLDFRADRAAEGIVASLLVTGYASAPKLDFISAPQRPKDEVLSVLLFGNTRASLSPTQLAALGAAVVQLGGGSSFDPLGIVRNNLGLDELSIESSSNNRGGKEKSSLEAGKYVMKGVYVGAKEGLSGSNTQAEVRVDLTKHLKFNTTVGTGGQITGFTTPENDPGSSLGLSYGIDY